MLGTPFFFFGGGCPLEFTRRGLFEKDILLHHLTCGPEPVSPFQTFGHATNGSPASCHPALAAGRGRRAWGCGAGDVVAVSTHVFDLAGAVRHDGRPGGDFWVRSRPGVRGTSACPRNRQGCGCLFLELVSNPKGYHQAKGQNPLDEPDEGELPWKIPPKNATRVGVREMPSPEYPRLHAGESMSCAVFASSL